MQPVFTVITVTYNAHSVLEHTILSVLNQTYGAIEYIIVDGASTDGTMQVIDKYRSRISKVVSEKDNGIYDAMNKGLAMATGDYVWFMNAGDAIYSPQTVAELVEQLNALLTDALPDILYGNAAIVDSNYEYLYMRRLKPPKKLTWRSFSKGMLVCHQAFIVKRSMAPMYDLQYRYSADFDWCIRCMKQTNAIYNSHLTLANYLNEGATTENLKASLKERFRIMCMYYGTINVVLNHIIFAIRFLFSKLTGKI